MHENSSKSSTICAIATAQGGAIGIIRVSGTDAVSIVNSIFSKDISQAKGYTMHYGDIKAQNENGEEKSSTPLSFLYAELHTHIPAKIL